MRRHVRWILGPGSGPWWWATYSVAGEGCVGIGQGGGASDRGRAEGRKKKREGEMVFDLCPSFEIPFPKN